MIKYNSSINKLFKTGFFHIFGSSVINKIVAFLSSIILVRILTKTEYGIFAYAWNIYSIVLLANGLGIESGILQMSSERSGNKKYALAISSYGSRFALLFDVILIFLLIGIGLFVPLSFEGAGELLYLLCLLPVFQLIYNLSIGYLRAQKMNVQYSYITIINTIIILITSVTGSLLFKVKGLVLSYYLTYSISILLGYFWLRIRLFSKVSLLEIKDKKTLLKISIISMFNNGLSQILYLLDVFVIGIVIADETVLASYKVATLIPSALVFIPISLMTYIYPYFAEHRNDAKWCLFRYKQIVIGLGSINALISAVLIIIAPYLFKIIFGATYIDAVFVFRILMVSYFISGTFRIISGNLLVTQRKLKFNLIVALISGTINVILNFFFIQWWGSSGAAFATLSVVIVSSILSTLYLINYWLKLINKKSNEY